MRIITAEFIIITKMFGRSKKEQPKKAKKVDFPKLVGLKANLEHPLPPLPDDKVTSLIFAYVGPMNEITMIFQVCMTVH